MKRSLTWTICRHHDGVVLWLLHLVGRPEDKGSVKLWPPFPLLPHCTSLLHCALHSTQLNLIPIDRNFPHEFTSLHFALPTRGQSSYGLAAISFTPQSSPTLLPPCNTLLLRALMNSHCLSFLYSPQVEVESLSGPVHQHWARFASIVVSFSALHAGQCLILAPVLQSLQGCKVSILDFVIFK